MDKEEVFARIKPIFEEVLDCEDIVITPELNADDIDEWDSLSHVRLIVTHEIEFGVRFETSEVIGLKNVGEFVDLLIKKIG